MKETSSPLTSITTKYADMLKLLSKLLTCPLYLLGKQQKLKRILLYSRLSEISLRKRAKSVGKNIMLRGENKVTKYTSVGENCILNGVTVYGAGECILADHVVIGQNTVIHTQNHDYDTGSKIPFGDGWTLKPVQIEEGAWIASSVIILPGTHIGEGAIIQAGSVVHGEIPPFAIAGGNPCRPFSQRNKERYLQLKEKGLWQTY